MDSVDILKAKLTIMRHKLGVLIDDNTDLSKDVEYDDELRLVVSILDIIETGDEHLINQYIDSL